MYKILYFLKCFPWIYVVVITAVTTSVSGGICYSIQQDKAGNIPLVFSELSHIEKNYTAQGFSVPAITRYYGTINDIVMKVFEANNLSYRRGGNHRDFAQELEFKIDPALRVHHLISEYATEIPGIARDTLEALKPLPAMMKELSKICNNLSNAWDESHHDVYHTEYYMVTDDKGNSHTESREVYDHTIHTYTYSNTNAIVAKAALDTFAISYPSLSIENVAPKILETGADNEDAISGKGKLVTSDKAKAAVIKNFQASTLYQNRPSIYKYHAQLVTGLITQYNKSLATSRSHRYITYSSSDAGPVEFRINRKILSVTSVLHSNINEIVVPVQQSVKNVKALHSNIVKYISVVLDKQKGDADDLRDLIMHDSKSMYRDNFSKGLDIETFSVGAFLGSIFLGVVLGVIMSLLLLRLVVLKDEF